MASVISYKLSVRIEVKKQKIKKFESMIPKLSPWLHTFNFDDKVFVGHINGIFGKSFVTQNSPINEIKKFKELFFKIDHEAHNNFFKDIFKDLAEDCSTALDIASATGKFSFILSQQKFKKIYSSEIRKNQCEQQKLIIDCASNPKFKKIIINNDKISADSKDFIKLYKNKKIDLVLSAGLLYHLSNPIQHLINCREIAKKYVIVNTKTHFLHNGCSEWSYKFEDKEWISLAWEGISAVPHYYWLPKFYKNIGFKSCKVVYPKIYSKIFHDFDKFDRKVSYKLRLSNFLSKFNVNIGLNKLLDLRRKNPYENFDLHPLFLTYILEV